MKALLFAGRLLLIHIIMLLVPSIADILLLGFMALTITCFAVAGVFSGVFCYSSFSDETSESNSRVYRLIAVLIVCVMLFFVVAPLSGSEYDIPVKSFAITEALTTIFLFVTKFQSEYENP